MLNDFIGWLRRLLTSITIKVFKKYIEIKLNCRNILVLIGPYNIYIRVYRRRRGRTPTDNSHYYVSRKTNLNKTELLR